MIIASTAAARRSRRWLTAFALVLGLVLIPAGVASAHAELQASDPADRSVVPEAPADVTLQFTEGVQVQPDGVRVLDGSGSRVDRSTATASDATVTVPLGPDLADGTYVVAWRVVSADGHPIRGSFQFSIGSESTIDADVVDGAFAGSNDGRDEVVAAVLRGLAYLGALGAVGLVVIGAALRRPDEPGPVSRLAGGSALLGLVAAALQLPVQASLATGLGWTAITQEGVFELAASDGAGLSALLVGGGLLAVAITTGLPFRGAARALALGGATVVPIGFAVTGHTRTMSPAALAYLADVVHVAAGAVWFGGLVALVVTLRRRRAAGDVRGAGEAVARFSTWAAAIVAAVVVAGTTLGWIEVGGWKALTTTTYGKLLLVKVAVVLLVLAGAAWNRFRLIGLIDVDVADVDDGDGDGDGDGEADGAPDGAAWTTLRRILRLEVAGLVVVLAITGVLSNVTPARTAVASGPVTVSAPLGEGTIEVTIDPASPGRNNVHAYIFDADDRLDDTYDAAAMELALPAQDIGPLLREPIRSGPGHFQLVATDLPLAGDWTLTIIVKPDRFTEQKATVTFAVR